nr:hypothetical protein [Tanacetum cinerariifolium]
MSSDNAQSVVTYTSISSNLDGPSWGIPLMNVDELSEMDPYEERRNRRRSKQPFILEESPIDTMADQRTMAELLRAPTEGYAEFFGLEKDNHHDHICWFNKITSTIKYKVVPNSAIKHMLFSFSLSGAARWWLMKAWDRYKDLIRAYPHHGFTELHQLDTFYNALNLADQDSLNAAAGGNLLERRTQNVLTIIENKSKVCNS